MRSHDAHALVASLEQERIICSLRDVNLRVAAHLYNSHDDIDTLLEALSRRRELLADRPAIAAPGQPLRPGTALVPQALAMSSWSSSTNSTMICEKRPAISSS